MTIAAGLAMVALGLLAWLGQSISALAPATAVRLSLMEAEDDVEPAFWADVRGEALWDVFTLWPMVVAGSLLIAGQDAWAYFGLGGGAIYLYFGGRGILTRLEMINRGLRIGSDANVRSGLTFLAVWGVLGAATIIGAVAELRGW